MALVPAFPVVDHFMVVVLECYGKAPKGTIKAAHTPPKSEATIPERVEIFCFPDADALIREPANLRYTIRK